MSNSIKALLVSFLLTGAACGGGSEGKDLARFTGVWTPISGKTTYTCSGQETDMNANAVTWTAGTSSDLIQAIPNSSCVIHADVMGDTASETEAQTCNIPGVNTYGDSVTDLYTYSAYTFVLGPDGKTATENFSGTVLETDSTSGSSFTCMISEAGASYQKQ